MLNHILATLNDYALALDQDEGKFAYISPDIHTLTGYNTSDFEANIQLWYKIIDKRDSAQAQSVRSNLAQGDCVNLTYRIVTANGKTKWVNEKLSLFIDEQSGHQILLSIVKDVQREEDAKYNNEESIAGYSILFDNNANPMWIYDVASLRILKINDAAVKTYGYTADEFLTMTIRDLRPAADLEKFDNFLGEKGLASGKLSGFHNSGLWKHLTKTGELIYAEINSDNICYKNQDCRIIVATNVTEKLHYQEEAKIREQFLHSLIDSQTNFLMRLDTTGLYTFVNKQFLKTFGYKNNEIIGKHFSFTTIPEETHLCRQAFDNCIAHPGKVIHLNHKKPGKNGRLHDTEWECIAITDENGKVTGLQAIGQDITERKDAQKEIIWTKNNLEALINNTEDLIWSVNRNCGYLYMNQAYRNTISAHAGATPEKGDSSLHAVYETEVLDEWRAYYHRAFKGERYIIVNESIDPSSGNLNCFEISFNPIYNAEAEITGVGCFARDITERIKTNKAIIDQNERLQNIASISSHDLRRPVATMLGLINIIDRENFYNPENKQILEHLLSVGNEIDDVIRLIVNNTFTNQPLIQLTAYYSESISTILRKLLLMWLSCLIACSNGVYEISLCITPTISLR